MNYSLGNMLGGAGALNADKLSLNLQFAADKTLTARRGPTPTFTRASTATFVGSNGLIQSAAINAARFDHDPVTLACKGLLIEESRTNSITGSNAFNTWTLGNATVASSSVVTPEGTADAWKLVEDSLTANHNATRAFTPTSGTTYTASVWVKSAENGFAFVGLTGGGFAATFISVNLSTGAVSTAVGTPVGAASVAYSNGWWRVSFSLAATASLSSIIDIRLSRDGNWANRSYLGNGVNGMYCYGGQVEAGSFPTSYIPTTTASVVRSADVCSITGSAFTGMYNTTEGTFFATASTFSPNTNIRRIVFATDGAITNRAGLLFNSVGSPTTFVASSGGSLSALIAVTVASITSPVKIAGAYKLDDFAISANGSAVTTDTSGLVGVGINRLNIGSQNDTETLNGHIASIRYYKKRLSNAKLQTITV
jgi:hypothetical protein